MTIDEVRDLILSNKNHKKYKIEDNEQGFTLTLNNFRLSINKEIADNIESEIPYTYLDADKVDRLVQVHDIEKDINTLLSRDWEPQVYSRGFHIFIGEPEESYDYNVDDHEFFRSDYYDLITSVSVDWNFDVTSGYAIADVVHIYTISSLPKTTLDAINNIDARDAIISDAKTYSDKYTDWYGKGFSKGHF